MSKRKQERIEQDDEDAFEANPRWLATKVKAKKKHVEMMLKAEVDDNGRSEWQWFRLANGDLIFGCYPRGDTYFNTEDDVLRP